ncbi:MAG: cytochrome C, partial [Bacteroidetes bacterium]
LGALAAILLLIQFVPIDRSVPAINAQADFLVATDAPQAIATTIRAACYDCHSYNTTYPWYAKVAPLSFWLQSHVKGGRSELNFSNWTSYPADKAAHKLEECAEEVSERHMPLRSYTWLHPNARLSDAQVSALSQWFAEMGARYQQ